MRSPTSFTGATGYWTLAVWVKEDLNRSLDRSSSRDVGWLLIDRSNLPTITVPCCSIIGVATGNSVAKLLWL